MPEFPHRLIFLRHGETAYNAENRLQGQLDIPLNARGREQARAVGRTLAARIGPEIDRLEAAGAFIASPLERARETMEIARDAMGLPPRRYALDPVLKEISFGAWEGLTWPEIAARDPKGVRTRKEDKWSFVPPRGESYAMLAERVRPWLDGLSRRRVHRLPRRRGAGADDADRRRQAGESRGRADRPGPGVVLRERELVVGSRDKPDRPGARD